MVNLPAAPAKVARLRAGSRRVGTRLSPDDVAGQMVWHCWPGTGGAKRALPLVLLHGGSGSWTHWLHAIEPLTAAGHTLWLADLPGFGDSDAPAGCVDVDGMIAPLAHGIEQLFGRASAGPVCDLVGFSFGGMAAGLLAAEYPQLVRSLTLVGAPGMGVTEGRAVRLKGWRHLASSEAQREAHRYNLAALMLHDARLIDEETLALHALNVARDRLPRRRLSQTAILAEALARVRAPVAAIYGEHDPLYQGRMAELEAVLRRQLGARLRWRLLPDAGHWVQHERPTEFAAALLAALDEMEEYPC